MRPLLAFPITLLPLVLLANVASASQAAPSRDVERAPSFFGRIDDRGGGKELDSTKLGFASFDASVDAGGVRLSEEGGVTEVEVNFKSSTVSLEGNGTCDPASKACAVDATLSVFEPMVS